MERSFFLEVKQVRHERPSDSSHNRAAGPDGIQLNKLLAARRERDSFFGLHLFSDPAWDILLKAYAAWLNHESCSVGELCAATSVPARIAARWVNKLEQDGWLVLSGVTDDAAIELSTIGKSTMEAYLASVWQSPLPL